MARSVALLLFAFNVACAEILTPPYFNLAQGKRITATATCGDEGSELYCKLVGANADHDEHVIQGQVCDICDTTNEAKSHPPEYAVDGMETWWQSPPLSRGMKYNEVNLTIDLGQEFHVAYVFVRMGNSPRPGLWALEKSTDYGKTFKPWQYFSDSPQDCERYFGRESLQPITKDDSVICSTEYSKIVPLEGGEIPISLLNYRPSANKYFNSSVLQEWTRATNVRLRLLRTKNLLGHLMSVARQDPTVTRRYFYSIKDISIGGRCMCNGHADTCDPADPETQTNILVCRCQHNTCGPQCNKCCTGFEQKKWRISQNWDRFSCEPCNCHNHTTECAYDPDVDEKRLSLDIHGRYEGGGVCQNCQHNTEGVNCNKCKPTYYRPYGRRWGEIDVCAPCNCDLHFSTGNCEEETGRCECRREYNPPDCDSCAYGYFDYPNCKPCTCNLNGTDGEQCTPTEGMCPCKFNYAGKSCEICEDGYYSAECKNCECNSVGSVSHVCDKDSGNCTCKSKYSGRTCNQCEPGYYNYPTCKHCNCDTSGTQPSICDDVTGQCICKTGFGGARCDQCISGFYMEVRGRERLCVPCNCSPTGSTSTSCSADGKCNCLVNFGGKQCDQCSPGYYKYPDCLSCNCDVSGSLGSTCDDNGLCHCKSNFDGSKCDRCKEQFYNYPACEECNCDPKGVIASFAGCGSVPAGELCQCKDRVQGRICNDCKPLFWNLQEYNPTGCEECNCYLAGTLGGLGACDTRTGQCTCKMHVGERQCDQCQDGFYKLESHNVFGCSECDCDIGGSIDNTCEKYTGQCHCHSRVEGRRCDRPIRAHYFPTLHQFQYEVEEGLTQSGPVRYRNFDEQFPGYSWKGYVVFSMLQNEVITVVHIAKSSLYRMVLKYANRLRDPVSATIVITPESVVDIQQSFTVNLKPTSQPQLITVAGEKGNAPAPFVMNPGNWTVTIKTNKEIMIDYFVLIPEAYYEATVLTKLVDKPCVIGDQELCRHFAYPNLSGRPTTGVDGLVTSVQRYIDDSEQLRELNAGTTDIPLLGNDQDQLQYNLNIDSNGPYVLLIEYITPVDTEDNGNMTRVNKGTVTVRFQSGDGPESNAIVNLNDCPYTSACRQVIVDDLAKIYVFNVQDYNNVITLEGEMDTLAGIKSIVAIPEDEWHLDYMTPRPYCLRRNGKCDPAIFSAAVDSKKVEMESGVGGDRETRPPILDNSTMVVYLSPESDPITIESKVPTPGEYMFVVHYYQPDHPASTLDAILAVDGQKYETSMAVQHCPSNSGCRALLRLATGNPQFAINENFTLVFKGNGSQGVWLDYLLVIATPDYMDTALTEANMLDYTREFIEKCANNHYYVNTMETGFCRDAVFSITAEYNSGTLGCFCDVEGSTDLECDTFGGQCRCRPNVIGRTCSACRTGYYGFPNCRPCNCPSTAICDNNGMCICPKNVEGENCDRCKPLTFNFDELRGCDDCNCNPLGVIGNQLQCERDNGNCACKQDVIGRVCDKCVPGHYAFPECVRCSCNPDGTTDDVCDQNTAQCYCKKQVTGQACDTCREEYFNLQSDNPDGCTKCHCFGKTTRCTSSNLFWAEINGMSDWSLANVELNRTLSIHQTLSPTQLNDSVISADIIDGEGPKILYFGAPEYYLGKRLTSYGGYLTYTIYYTARFDGHAIPAPDVIIGGANGYIVHNSIEQPPALDNWMHSVRISEDEFTNVDGSAVTRDQFMHILVNVTSIYVRAAYEVEAVATRLIAVTLDVGVEDYSDYPKRASSVEECQCPKAYRGISCEQCAEGYYRLSTGPHAGFCVPCQCNGHSRECDVNTGICLECLDNTMGDHCEQCIPGYHGDATTGTPRDCLICACPMPYASNNFAIGCDLSENGSLISCDCKPGYGGPRCEFCAAGYYGLPENIGDYCKPCNCSGNIILEDPGSCDSINGNCLKCVNNTAGAACNLCAPGFFGDAIFSKNCTACSCDEFGMERCDPETGTCVCRPGVIGDKCDRCAPDHWGINTGLGCAPCACGLASNSTQCDDNSGQCSCAKGVTGRHCEQCAAGYWNYTKKGCDHCNCNTGYSVGFMCNATGQCECLPGVIGEKCDRCPDRWVLLPQEGCLQCDSCTDALIFSVEDMSYWLGNETQDFKDKADSFFTTQRLNYISNQTQLLRPRVAELRNVEVADVTAAVKGLETNARNLLRSAEFAATDSDKQIGRAAALTADADEILGAVREKSQRAKDVVAHVAELATGLELSQQPKVDSALAEAGQIKSDIAAKDMSPKTEQAAAAFTNASAQIERMNVFVEPVNQQAKKFDGVVNGTRALIAKLHEMLEYTDLAQHTADMAEKLNTRNRLSKVGNKVMSVTKLNSDAMKDLIGAAMDISNATFFNLVAADVVKNASKALTENGDANNDMQDRLARLTEELPELTNLTDVALDHARSLRNRADNLRALAERENNNTRTQHAYSAASAYSSIVQEIGDAKRAADEAETAINNATDINALLLQRVGPARDRSAELSHRAATANTTVQYQLRPNLTAAERALSAAARTLSDADDEDNAIQLSLPNPGDFSLEDEMAKAENVNATVKSTQEVMSQMGSDLAASKEWAQTLPKQADEAQKMQSNVENLVNNINEMKPNISSTYRTVKMRQDDLEDRRREADEKLNKLRSLIEQARTVTNRIQVGVTFDRHSTLQPRLPDTVDEMSTSNHVSAYFRTKEKNGFLLYLGNPKDTMLRRTKSDDFMVLSVQNGYPYLVMDIGDSAESGREPARIGSDKYVADYRWYQVIVDRVGRNVKLSIRESLDNDTEYMHSKEAVLPGQHTIFNLDRQKSKLYVGGVPSDAKLQGISFPAFEGEIEELMIGDTPVGLWNFASAENLKGAQRRKKLITSQSGPQEYRFNGRGHVTMPEKHYQDLNHDQDQVLLFFRTYAPDGLMYLVGEGAHFFSLQMQDGRVYLQVSLGDPENLLIIGTSKTYNDGKWHRLDARRVMTTCSLQVDNEMLTMESSSSTPKIAKVDTINFGGNNKGIIQVTDKGFDGCMRQISINGVNVDLSESMESIGVAYGCQFASLVSLSGDDSYLRFVDITTENLHLTLKFKTAKPDGLLFLYVSRMQTATSPDSISLSLIKGKLVLMSQRDQLDTALSTYNDSQWHVVTVTLNNNALRLVVDDFDYFSTDTVPEPLHILDGVLFIGGVQPGYVVGGRVGTKAAFQGCIADATLRSRVLNLLEPYSNHSVTFGRCGTTTTTGGVAPDGTSWPEPPKGDILPTVTTPPQTPPPTQPPDITTIRVQPSHELVPTVVPLPRPSPASTPSPARTSTRPPPQAEAGCALAYDPYYGVGNPEEGYRFGTSNTSHIKYRKLPGRQRDGFDLTITFRTFDQHGGLIFYAAAEADPTQFLAVYMKDGQIYYAFNCGAETGLMTSPQTYNDANWHTVTVVRNGGHGKLAVDSERVAEASVACSGHGVLAAPYYYGGANNFTDSFAANLMNFYQPFKGCLKGLMMNGQYVTEVQERANSLRCSDNVEDGIYFGASSNGASNYLKLFESFKVGNEISISMEVKPRNSTGLLLSIHGKRDFLVLELLENEVVANVENGKGPFHASYKLGNKFSLCDGNWHRIHAVKSRHVVSVGVDGHFSDAGLGQSSSTDTRSAVYIGGHERAISKVRGTRSKRGFTGCIKNIVVKDTVVIPLSAAGRNTHIGVCPLD